MLSYRHAFHAGNFADVFKHCVLDLLLRYMLRKNKPFCYLDLHAGAGGYRLDEGFAAKNCEYRHGIARFWQQPAHELMEPYLRLVQEFQTGPSLDFYPGSPMLARRRLRDCDRVILNELHPADLSALRTAFDGDAQVTIHQRDAWEALGALVPPQIRRGVVLLDPAYETASDYEQAPAALAAAARRWPAGRYALWYPIVTGRPWRALRDGLGEQVPGASLIAEIGLWPEDSRPGMTGCGMLLVQPPWGLADDLDALLPWLVERLAGIGPGRWVVQWRSPH